MIKPLHDKVILQPSSSDMRGTLFIPKAYIGISTSCLVIDKGEQVSRFITSGSTVLCETGFGERTSNVIDGTNCFICKSQHIYAVIKNGSIWPIGRKILIRRDMADEFAKGILIPENRRFQSLTGTIERLGLLTNHFKVKGLTLGSKIRLTEWQESMIQVTLEDGSHGLIVNEKDILCKYED